MSTYKIGDRLDRTKLGTRLVDPSELFALKFGGKWWPSYRSAWDNGKGQLNVTTINESNEAEIYITGDGLNNMPSFRNVMTSDGPNGPLRITPRLMTSAERAFVNTRSELSQQTWVSASPSSMVDIVAPYYAEIRCDMPPKPNGSRTALWRAFWQLVSDQNWQNGPEFDIMEEFGERPAGQARITTGIHSSTGATWATADNQGRVTGGALKGTIDAGVIPGSIEWVTTGTASQNLNMGGIGNSVHVFGGWVDTSGFFIFVDDVCKWVWPYATDFNGRQSYISANFAIGKGGTGAGDIQPNETTVGTWTIYDIGAYAIGASTPTPVPTPTPTPTPTPSPGQAISVATPIPAAVADKWSVSGSGSGNKNVAAFTADWAMKLSPDVTPNATGAWGLTLDTSKLPAGVPTAVIIVGFSVAAGQTGGNTITVPFTLTRSLPTPTPTPVPTPTPTPTGLTAAQKAAVTTLGTDLTKAQADFSALKSLLGMA